ncbi:alanine/glycine:cation symporter family protein [Anaerococcus cruorum]|uniref:alanine/glycine:cation symporter family protein n=1 Tax=Anaerococcus sp. WGS1596 TaxID=3366806 RepID=UPI00372CF7B2
MEAFKNLTSALSDVIYTWMLIPLLLGLGIYFTIKIRAGQISNIGHAKNLITAKPKDENAISPFKAFTISAASHIGTGNVVGVAAAISVGGPGAVFWMWITALIGGASAFVENTLGQIFKEKNADGSFKGGPAFYINKTIKKPGLANLFSVIICIVYGFMFNAMQSNTIASGFSNSFSTTPWIIGLLVVIISGFVIFGGLQRISDITSLLVPVMAVAYIGLVIFILITNITKVPHMFGLIFKDAFNLEAGLGGLFGTAVLNGVKRGLFSNEAGMGAVPNASSVADVSHPAKQGLIQALGVYLDTILICSVTAFVIIIGGEEIYLNPNLKGLDITQAALATEIGPWAQHFLTICVLMFAFSSIIGNYYYGENNILAMGLGKIGLTIYRILVLAFVFFGSVGDFSIVWNTGDIFMGIMAILNLVVLMIIGKCAVATYYDYIRQLKEGKDPVFNPREIKELSPYLDEIKAWDD